jgi:hypothetical protein
VQNPTTGATGEMLKEIPFKVPADYDENTHIAQWKAEQAAKGKGAVCEKRYLTSRPSRECTASWNGVSAWSFLERRIM